MNVIVTGASSGIGYEMVKQFVLDSRVNRVFAIARRKERLTKLSEECGSDKLTIKSFDLQSGDYQVLLSNGFFKECESIDVLINNAGLLINKPFEELSIEDFRASYEVNVFGPVRLIQSVLPKLKASKSSHVVNISSMGGFQGSAKFTGLSAYSSSKSALACFSECLAEELKDENIKVNCLALGAVQTEMLESAFPGYKAPLSSAEMAAYIAEFGLSAHEIYNGKVIPVSLSTP